MNVVFRKLFFSFFIFCNSCVAYEFKSADEFVLSKNYALSACVASNYEGESIYQDALDALSGNREYGNMPLDSYHEINEELVLWGKKKYMSKSGNKSEFFMCIDFHNSNEIAEIYNRYDPCKDKKQWLDEKKYSLKCEKNS